MSHVFGFLAEQPLLFLGVVIAIGALVGRLSISSVALGPVAVLFVSIVLTAWGTEYDEVLEVPEFMGSFGLAIFAFATGLMAGPSFFASLRHAWKLVVAVALLLICTAGVGLAVGGAFGLSREVIAGTFAGAMNNTPALAAAGGTPEATVGYASAYVYGVVAMLVMTSIALGTGLRDQDTPAPVIDATLRIDTDQPITIGDLKERHGHQLAFSRVTHHAADPVEPVDDDSVLRRNDLVTVVGPETEVEALVDELGHRSSHDLTQDRSSLDFRRITISDPRLAGRRLEDLHLEERFDASITRVRRGDIELVSTPDAMLQLGDRVRVVAPPDRISEVSNYFGDSSRGLSDVNPVALGVGLSLGLGLGLVQIPGLSTLSIGAAAGCLLVGLAMGRIGRIGRFVTTLPHTSASVLVEIGLLVFLAFAGTRAGSLILSALRSGEVVDMVVTGAAMTTTVGVGVYVIMRWGFRVGRTRMSGVMAGTHTQPALLAFANSRTGHDPRVALGYALVYPTAMVTKILLAQLIVTL